MKLREEDLARKVVSWLNENGWTVYQEVSIEAYGGVADIVAVMDRDLNGHTVPLVWIIECKGSHSLRVISQANHWIGIANFVSVATPIRSGSREWRILSEIHHWKGIGLLKVGSYELVDECIAPRFYRRSKSRDMLRFLTEEHKSFALAGNSNGRRFTPFQATKMRLLEIVRDKPGISLKEALMTIPHHYSSNKSAMCAISNWIRNGTISELEICENDRHLTLFIRPTDGIQKIEETLI